MSEPIWNGVFLQKRGGDFFEKYVFCEKNQKKIWEKIFWKKKNLYFGQENVFEYKNLSVAPKLDLQIENTVFFGVFLPHGGRPKK